MFHLDFLNFTTITRPWIGSSYPFPIYAWTVDSTWNTTACPHSVALAWTRQNVEDSGQKMQARGPRTLQLIKVVDFLPVGLLAIQYETTRRHCLRMLHWRTSSSFADRFPHHAQVFVVFVLFNSLLLSFIQFGLGVQNPWPPVWHSVIRYVK